MKTTKLTYILAVVLLIGLGFLIYSNTFDGVFHFDDFSYIVNNSQIRDVSNISNIWQAAGRPTRFISYLSFALNYHFHGLDVFGYHLVNTLIHILNACLVLWLGVLLKQRFAVAFFASLLFLTHPLQTEAVSYIVQRFTSLATLFYLLAVCAYLKYRSKNDPRWLALVVVSTLTAMFTKQIAFTLPVILLALEFFFISKKRILFSWKWFVPFVLFLLIIPVVLRFDFMSIFGRTYPSRSHTGDMVNVWTYALTQTRVIWQYIRLFFVPLGQTLDYDFIVSTSLKEWKVLAGLAGILGIFWVMVKKYTTHRFVVFGLFWFFVTISITTSIVPIPQVIFEHRCYLPSVGLFMALSWLAAASLKNPKQYTVFVTVIVCLLSFLTFQRNKVWQSDVTLWEDIVAKAPAKVRGYNNLGIAYFADQRFEEAVTQFNQVIEMNPNAARAYNNRGLAYAAMGEEQRALANYNQAIDVYTHSRDPLTNGISTAKVWSELYNNRGNLLKLKKRLLEAERDYQKALEVDPRNQRAHYNLGFFYEEAFQFDQAFEHYAKAVELDPRYYEAHQALGLIYHAKAQYDQAITSFSKAIALKPHFPLSYYYRSLSYYQMHNLQAAKSDLRQSMELGYQPDDPRLNKVFKEILAY